MKIEKSKKVSKWNLFGGGDGFEEAVIKGPFIEIFSNTQIVIEGCGGVLEYNENYLKLRLASGALVLEGENFDVVSFENKTIFVKGKINSLEFAV
jgi:sporulation protein YqfC